MHFEKCIHECWRIINHHCLGLAWGLENGSHQVQMDWWNSEISQEKLQYLEVKNSKSYSKQFGEKFLCLQDVFAVFCNTQACCKTFYFPLQKQFCDCLLPSLDASWLQNDSCVAIWTWGYPSRELGVRKGPQKRRQPLWVVVFKKLGSNSCFTETYGMPSYVLEVKARTSIWLLILIIYLVSRGLAWFFDSSCYGWHYSVTVLPLRYDSQYHSSGWFDFACRDVH